jgi:DNA polymerase-3 subunit gamma/tau
MDMAKFFGALLDHFRSLLLVKVLGADTEVLDLGPEERAVLLEQVKDVGREDLQRYIDILLAEEESVRRSGNPRLTLETILVRMAYLEPLLPVDQVLGRLERLEERLSGQNRNHGGGNPAARPEAGAESGRTARRPVENASADGVPARDPGRGAAEAADAGPGAPPPGGDPEQVWEGLKQYIKNQSYPLWSKIEPGRVKSLEEQRIVIDFPTDYVFLEDLHLQKSRLQELAVSYFGGPLTVQLETTAPEGTAENGTRERQENGQKNRQRQEALNSPALQKVLDLFEGAEVREIRSK